MDEEEKINFSLTKKGGIRLVHVLSESPNEKQIQDVEYNFPKDIELYNLTIFGASLEINLRIEFDKCMADEKQVEKLKRMSEDEITKYLEKETEFFAEENERSWSESNKKKGSCSKKT